MWWFDRSERKEIWDEEIQWPIGDIEAAHRIRDICRSAADSAAKIAGAVVRSDKEKKSETERYERAARVAMEIALKISDGLLRDSSVRQIMVSRQRAMGGNGGVVMEGRDIGTAVFPNADVKVFLDADARVRAERRVAQNGTLTPEEAQRTIEDLVARDQRDRTRHHLLDGPGEVLGAAGRHLDDPVAVRVGEPA